MLDAMVSSFDQISQKRRDAMDALTKDELIFEIGLANKSRFSQSQAYLNYRLAKLEEEERASERKEDSQLAQDAVDMSRQANALSSDANSLSEQANEISFGAKTLSKWALGLSALAVLISLCALAVQVYGRGDV